MAPGSGADFVSRFFAPRAGVPEDPVTGSVTFPTYDVYLAQPGRPVSPALIGQLSAWRFGYLVVDRRMATEVPEIQIYFENNEPIAQRKIAITKEKK